MINDNLFCVECDHHVSKHSIPQRTCYNKIRKFSGVVLDCDCPGLNLGFTAEEKKAEFWAEFNG